MLAARHFRVHREQRLDLGLTGEVLGRVGPRRRAEPRPPLGVGEQLLERSS